MHLAQPPYRGSFFLIDPLDGTKEFVAGRDEFTVNLALVTNGTPLLGIIGAPALGLIWRGLVGRGAERLTTREGSVRVAEPIHTRPLPQPRHPWIVAVSRSHGDKRTEAFIEARPGAIRQPSARRSNSAAWRRAEPTSIPASPPPANGTSRPAMPSSPPPAARSRMRRAKTCVLARGAKALSCRNSSPGAILRQAPRSKAIRRLCRALHTAKDASVCRKYCSQEPASPGSHFAKRSGPDSVPAPASASWRPQETFGIGGEGIPAFLAAEQIKPLSEISQNRGLPA